MRWSKRSRIFPPPLLSSVSTILCSRSPPSAAAASHHCIQASPSTPPIAHLLCRPPLPSLSAAVIDLHQCPCPPPSTTVSCLFCAMRPLLSLPTAVPCHISMEQPHPQLCRPLGSFVEERKHHSQGGNPYLQDMHDEVIF